MYKRKKLENSNKRVIYMNTRTIGCGIAFITASIINANAQDAVINLTATIGGVCQLSQPLNTSGSTLNVTAGLATSTMAFSNTNFKEAQTGVVKYSVIENTACIYSLESSRNGMKNGSSVRDYTAQLKVGEGNQNSFTTSGGTSTVKKVTLESIYGRLDPNVMVTVSFSETDSSFIPLRGEYTDTLTLKVVPN